MSFTYHAGLSIGANWGINYAESDLGRTFTAPLDVARSFHAEMHAPTRHGGYWWTLSAGTDSSYKQAVIYHYLIGSTGVFGDPPDELVNVSGPTDDISPNYQVQALTMSLSPWVQQPNGNWLATQALNLYWDPTPEPNAAALVTIAMTAGGYYCRTWRTTRRPR
jgi:hypothetical protein